MSNYSSRFVNNNHWNEIGNLAAVSSLIKNIYDSPNQRENEMTLFLNKKIRNVENYYSKYDSKPRLMFQDDIIFDKTNPLYDVWFNW